MPWELKKVEDRRKELIEAYVNGSSMTELCKFYKISRKTAYKWFNRCLELGLNEGLKDLSKAPHQPIHRFTDKQFDRAINLKLQRRSWGPKKILVRLEKDYPEELWPSPTRLYEVFKDHHLVTSRRLRKRVPATHPLGDVNNSNDVWIADFKGWFLTQDRTKCEPITITDGYTRYLISCNHVPKKSADFIWPIFEEAFKEYGLPKRIRTDNGPPFGCIGIGRLTSLSINLIKAGVVPEWINPGHPEENGRHERFHLTLKQAVANPPEKTLKEQIARMKDFQEEYNFERPHEALGQETPGSHYYASQRQWDGILRQPEYDTKLMKVRKVCQSGCIWLNQEEYFLGQVLTGEYVGMKELEEGELEVYYGPIYLGKLRHGYGMVRPKMRLKKIIRRA
jgi:putative transposase